MPMPRISEEGRLPQEEDREKVMSALARANDDLLAKANTIFNEANGHLNSLKDATPEAVQKALVLMEESRTAVEAVRLNSPERVIFRHDKKKGWNKAVARNQRLRDSDAEMLDNLAARLQKLRDTPAPVPAPDLRFRYGSTPFPKEPAAPAESAATLADEGAAARDNARADAIAAITRRIEQGDVDKAELHALTAALKALKE